ncbi:glycine--tRNA ligase subunit beta [Desulfobulbus rhabdoformis]|uniref:glycine--tRNA ligase subunit beta n=1 Tax=Desulfobulbus rhabdoformis TaxID=34032 RepID=UPI001964726E|nr:glycine--tRNA ligase subunit beta [Desulfobulbus rhabdoformis]MBM9613904.1 glycine--tRNA ligase subunit beta [Desulfobulbus rhabdoformis]
MSELLFEIGTEEIPAGYIQPALNTLAEQSAKKLGALELTYGAIRTYGTPRRLTLIIEDLQARQADRSQEHIGPSKKAGYDDDGNPTKAAIGFARSKGCDPAQLQVVETPKGEYLMVVEDVQGQETKALLPAMLESLIRELVFPKSMKWSDYAITFARPIQWLAPLYDGEVLPVEVEGVSCGNTSRGHRFLSPNTFELTDAKGYLELLRSHSVIADPKERREMVIAEVKRAVKEHAHIDGAAAILHEGLLDTVTNLVEYPYGVCGRFDEKFLQLPDETLVTSMREHQKYFPVAGSDGKLLPLFVAVNNTKIDDIELAASGHQRVLRARLEDGLFFFNEDKKQPLASLCPELKGIVFQNKLGTMLAKSERMVALSATLARLIAPELEEDAKKVATLAKADLLSQMVGEFPSLQGIMGRVYAENDGEKAEIALAIQEHYLPVRAGGAVPSSLLGALVGIADRLDTLVGCFAIGEKPTGNKDAFGLRRQAIGLISIIKGLKIAFSLQDMATAALEGYAGVVANDEATVLEVMDFIRLRFENDQVAAGLPQELVEAATSVGFDDMMDCIQRIEALEQIRSQESFAVLAGSFKRIRNIIKENAETTIDEALLSEPAEKSLYAAFTEVKAQAQPLIEEKEYCKALLALLEMKEPVDQFFDQVMVMAKEDAIRQNRLNLLTGLGELVLSVGDISRMHVE